MYRLQLYGIKIGEQKDRDDLIKEVLSRADGIDEIYVSEFVSFNVWSDDKKQVDGIIELIDTLQTEGKGKEAQYEYVELLKREGF